MEKDAILESLNQEMTLLKQEMTVSSADRYRKQLEEKGMPVNRYIQVINIDTYIKTLEKQVADTRKDFELLSMDWNRIDKVLKAQVRFRWECHPSNSSCNRHLSGTSKGNSLLTSSSENTHVLQQNPGWKQNE